MSRAFAFEHPHLVDDAQLTALLGGKGANLATMTRALRLPVPPGFTVTTDTCKEYLATGWPVGLDAEIDRQIGLLEERVGRRLGDPDDPLLVSVRSGAPVSMPGMMDTILNLGLNVETVEGLARRSNDDAFARDCHQRFVEMFRSIVGVDEVPESPREQLRAAIEAVFSSWNSARARVYRTVEGIDHDLGTAVTVQTMVFGNRSDDSATGVLFTRDPSTGDATRFGDVLFKAQGEDVVDGSHDTQPLTSLSERLPDVAMELWRVADILERHERDLCDIEFTVEDGTLWLLQVRVGKRSPRAALRIAMDMAEEAEFPLTRREAIERVASLLVNPPRRALGRNLGVEVIATGIAASPGVATGQIVTSPEDAVSLAAMDVPVILVRTETSPSDVHGMAAAAGILTSRGGLASHAAVVARGWGIPAVVGAAAVIVHEDRVDIGDRSLALRDVITIDGDTGQVFEGQLEKSFETVPEAAVMLGWAEELGIDFGALTNPAVAPACSHAAIGHADIAGELVDAIVRIASIKNFVTVDALAPAVGLVIDDVVRIVQHLVDRGLAEEMRTMYRLTHDGLDRARRLLADDQTTWGISNAEVALDDLHDRDQRMKRIVTRWQVRSVDGADEMNDHNDETYDRLVLAELSDLHTDTEPWLAGLAEGLPRLEQYRRRLGDALERAVGGDGRYVAGPMLDSYHTVWFEMHEDLIRLAGRSREAEAAAGRA